MTYGEKWQTNKSSAKKKKGQVILESDHRKKRNTDVQIKHSRYNSTETILAKDKK